jgi:hypothetical protein
MSAMRDRAKEQFPMVLLTLLSIVQALALELLWSHLSESDFLFHLSTITVISWIQIIATFLGLVLIWVVYASIMMRFRWVPGTSDSIFPFVIGLFEFMMIESLGQDEVGLWLILMAALFGMMVWVSHVTMQRARRDNDNDLFFSAFAPAVLRDFIPQFIVVGTLALAGVYVFVSGNTGLVALLMVLATCGLMCWQFYQAAQFWERSVGKPSG